jgi:uncharacterized damage-inducible protein DinB
MIQRPPRSSEGHSPSEIATKAHEAASGRHLAKSEASLDEHVAAVYEMNQDVWSRLENALADLADEEIDWRPVPEANSINDIVRHLRIEAEWHSNSLRDGTPMPTIAAPVSQEAIDAIPLNFRANLAALRGHQARYLEDLHASTLENLKKRTSMAYGDAGLTRGKSYLIAYHHAVHMATHCGQIRMLRNLYRTTKGKPALFVPVNPTYPAR